VGVSDKIAQLGKRIRLVRKEHRISQRLVAAQVGLSRQQLYRVEQGEVAIGFLPGLRFCEFTNRNPLWLAYGESQNRFGFFWPIPTASDDPRYKAFTVATADWTSDSVVAERTTFLEAIERHKDRFSTEMLFLATSDVNPRWSAGAPKRIEAPLQRESKEKLTFSKESPRVGSMNLHKEVFWPKLRDRISKLVQRRGMKAALARDIGVTRQTINALLKKKRVRSAEYALRLFKWVEIAEVQQKQRIGVPKAPARKARPTRLKPKS